MRTSTLIFICLLAILAIVELAQSQNLCDNEYCSMACLEDGRHGECGHDDICRCHQCIYRYCKRMCRYQGMVGQCDENECLCL